MSDEQVMPAQIKKSSISPLWLFTLLAFILAAWLLHKSLSEAGVRINIHFHNAQGIEPGRTAIRYQGLDVGVIRSITLEENLIGVRAEAEIFPKAKQILRKDTLFWIVRPKASITGISGLDALVGGNYIALLPGKDEEQAQDFTAIQDPPNIAPNGDNLLIYLVTDDLNSLSVGSGIYYKKIQVGEVFNYELNENDQQILLSLQIQKKYAHLIKENSRFWNISGIKARVGLDGVNLEIGNLPSVLTGGIAFDSPKNETTAEQESIFRLYPSINEAQRGIAIHIALPKDHGIKNQNLAISYKGTEVGKLTSIDYQHNEDGFIAQANIDPSMKWLLNTGTKIILEKPDLGFSGVKNITNFVTGNSLSIKAGEGTETTEFIAVTEKRLIADHPNSVKIRLTADDAWGIGANTKVVYRGIEVGFVDKYELQDQQAVIDLVIYSTYKHLIKSHNRFYRLGGVSGSINAEGVEFNLAPAAQLVQGAISFISKGNEDIAKEYTLFDSKSQAEKARTSKIGYKELVLVTDKLPSISEGSPVMFKNIVVGKVTNFRLENARVTLSLSIENQYAHLLTKDTVFWNNSGIGIEANLSGVNIQTGSLKSIMSGGISFADLKGITNKKDGLWILYDSLRAAQTQGVVITFTSNKTHGLDIGSQIKYQGVKVGEVTQLSPNFEDNSVSIKASIQPEFAKHIARKSSYFWVALPSIGLSKMENLDSLFSTYISVEPGQGKKEHQFILHDTQQFVGGLSLVLETMTRDSIDIGTPILFRNFKVGEVTKVSLGHFADRVLINIQIMEKYKHLVRTNTVFWNHSGINVSLGITGANIKTDTMENLLRGGITFATPKEKTLASTAKEQHRFLLHQEPKPEWMAWRTAISKPN